MAYTKEQRAAAAKAGWQKRREQPTKLYNDYGLQGNPQRSAAGVMIDSAPIEPTYRDPNAGGMARWPDDIYDLDAELYRLMENSSAIRQPEQKVAGRIGGLDCVVIGVGAKHEYLQARLDEAYGLPEFVAAMVPAWREGYRACQMKPKANRSQVEPHIVPNFIGGLRRKINVGAPEGTIAWDGVNLVKYAQWNGVSDVRGKPVGAVAETLDRGEHVIYRPGIGSNPEGDLSYGLAAAQIAKDHRDAKTSLRLHVRKFGIATLLVEKDMKSARPGQVQTTLGNAAAKGAQLTAGSTIGKTTDDKWSLLEAAQGTTEGLIEYCRFLAEEIHMLLLQNSLTSTTADSGPAGSTSVHLNEEDKAVWYIAWTLAEAITNDVLPWIEKYNPDIPPLGADEESPWVMFLPHGNRGKTWEDIREGLAQQTALPEPGEDEDEPEDDDTEDMAALFERMERNLKGQAPTALAAFTRLRSAY